nr:PAS domain S-box protein [Thioalkalivibrio sp. ALE23]
MAELAALSPDRRPIFGGQHAMDPENTHSAFFEHAPVGMAVVDADGCLRAANRRLSGLLDREADVLVGQTLTVWLASAEADRVAAAIHSLIHGDTGEWRDECRLLPRQGPPLWVELALSRLPDADDGAARLALTATDIDARKASEAERDELEHFYQQTFTNNVAVKLLIDPDDGRIVDANPAAETFYGWSIEELKNRPIQAINTLSAEEVQAEMERAAEEERLYFRFRHRVASGEIRDVEVYSGPVWLRGKRYLHSIIHDVTEHHRAEREQRELLQILEAAPDFIGMADPDGRILYQNPAFDRALGLTGRATPGERAIDDFHPEPVRRRVKEEALPTAARDGVWRGETELRTADGKSLPVSQTIVAHRDDTGAVHRYSTILHDISAIRAAEAFRNQLLESLAEGVFGLDREGRYTFLNPAACRLLGYEREADALGLASHETSRHSHADGSPYPLEDCPIYRVLQTGKPLEAWEDVFWRPDGHAFPVLVYAAPLHGSEGEPTGAVVSFQDISERKAARQRMETLLQTSPAVIYTMDPAGFATMTYLSNNAEAVIGWRPEEVTGNPRWLEHHIHPDDHAANIEAVGAWLAAGARGTCRLQYRQRHGDGHWMHIEDQLVALRDGQGRVKELVGAFQDVSDRVESETRLRTIARHLPGALYQYREDADGTPGFPYFGEGLEQLTGLLPSEATGDAARLFSRIPAEDLEALRASAARSRETLEPWQQHFRVRHPQRGEVWLDGRATPERQDDGSTVWNGVLVDITTRVAAEQALRQREAELNQAQRIARMGSWVSDFRVNEIRWSDEIYRIFGRQPEDGPVTHETFMETVHPHDRAAVQAALEASFAGEPYDIVHRVVRSDGEVRTVRERGHTEFDDTGQPIRMLGTVQDITEQRQLEDSLRRLVSILDSTPDVVSMHGPDGAMLYLNAAGRRLMGLPEPELADHWDPETGWNRAGLPGEMDTVEGTIERVHPPWALERVREEALPAAMEHGLWQGETALLDGEGRERPASQVVLIHRDADGAIAQTSTIIRDITERKRIEMELERSNAELEQFAYAVSHDLQEPLRINNSYLGLLERRHAEALDDKARRYIDTATDAAARMRQMIQDLLEYSRVQRMGEAFAPVALDRALDDACDNLQAAIADSGARITREALPTVQGDAGQLMRLFQNLLSNAIKYRAPETTPEIHVGCTDRGDHWEIRVTDNGIGIDPEQIGRIFQVFQRLHGRGEYEGTGAGLALARRIVERHGGQIRAESEGEGHGTTFCFTLPRQPMAAAAPE